MLAADLADLILRIGAVSGALAVTAGTIAAVLRFTSRRFAETVREVVSDRLEEIKINTEQLKPNGGSTIADAVRRVEARQIEIAGETRAVRQALEQHLADHTKLI